MHNTDAIIVINLTCFRSDNVKAQGFEVGCHVRHAGRAQVPTVLRQCPTHEGATVTVLVLRYIL